MDRTRSAQSTGPSTSSATSKPYRRPSPLLGAVGLPHLFMLIAGLVTFVLVSSVLRDRSATTEVWMAAADLPAGSTLSAGDLVAVDVSSDDPMLSAMVTVGGGVPDGTIRADVVAGEPILVSRLVPSEAADVGRSFTVPVETLVLDGLGLRTGDRIDVIGPDEDGSMAYVVADVEVVRLPGAAANPAFAAAPSRTAWVTVRIDHGQALELSAALDRGDVTLVRSTGAAPLPLERVSDR